MMHTLGKFVAAASCVVLLSSCAQNLPFGPEKRLQRQVAAVDGVTGVEVTSQREGGIAPKTLGLTADFDPGLATPDLEVAVEKVCEIADNSDHEVDSVWLRFGKGNYGAPSCSIDPSTGILELVSGLEEYSLGPSAWIGGMKFESYSVRLMSDASDIQDFRDDVNRLYAVFEKGHKTGLVRFAYVEEKGDRSDYQRNLVTLSHFPDGEEVELLDSSLKVTDLSIVKIQFDIEDAWDSSQPSLKVFTNGRPNSVAEWLRGVAQRSPLDVHIEAIEYDPAVAEPDAWLDEVG